MTTKKVARGVMRERAPEPRMAIKPKLDHTCFPSSLPPILPTSSGQ